MALGSNRTRESDSWRYRGVAFSGIHAPSRTIAQQAYYVHSLRQSMLVMSLFREPSSFLKLYRYATPIQKYEENISLLKSFLCTSENVGSIQTITATNVGEALQTPFCPKLILLPGGSILSCAS
jgi:hypothetical protein